MCDLTRVDSAILSLIDKSKVYVHGGLRVMNNYYTYEQKKSYLWSRNNLSRRFIFKKVAVFIVTCSKRRRARFTRTDFR